MSQNLTYIRGGVHRFGNVGDTTLTVALDEGPKGLDERVESVHFGAGSRGHLEHIAEDLIRIVKAQPDRRNPLLGRDTEAAEGLLLMAADLTRIAKSWPY